MPTLQFEIVESLRGYSFHSPLVSLVFLKYSVVPREFDEYHTMDKVEFRIYLAVQRD